MRFCKASESSFEFAILFFEFSLDLQLSAETFIVVFCSIHNLQKDEHVSS